MILEKSHANSSAKKWIAKLQKYLDKTYGFQEAVLKQNRLS